MKFGSLQVRTPDGEAREFPIDLPSLVVGRADGNGIVIDDLSISRRHARIVIESGRLLVEDLGSAAGTFVGGHRIDPGVSNLVENDQDIRFGDVQAQFLPPPPTTASEAEAGIAALAEGAGYEAVEEAPSRAINVTLTSPATPVEPGGAVFATAVIQNRGRVVDLVTLGVTGIPTAWVTFSQATLALVPGTRETVTLVIQPPVSSESLAGEYDFGVVVTSGEHEREGVAFGKLVVTAFEASELSLTPMRSKRDFAVVAKNNGNALVTYALSGIDDEGQFIFDFDAPSIELQPGHERKLPLRVRKKKRHLFGRMSYVPIRIVATPTSGAGIAVEAPGQLVVKPPLERWKTPSLMAVLLGVLALAAWLSWVNRQDIPSWIPWSTKGEATTGLGTNPEAAYAGVHMCEKTPEEREKALAKVSQPAAGSSGAPLFAQSNPAWGKDEYAKAGDPEFGPDWCGETIEQCGCAMTSVATIMALFNVLTMPDGSDLTPQAVNEWFNGEARKTTRGWVSRGYIYGDVIWTAANELSGQIAKQRPGTPTLRFAGFGTGSEEEIKAELQAGRPLVLEVPGHFIAAVGVSTEGKILINDPYYRDRLTLDAYKGKVRGSVKFEPSNDLSGVVITVPKDLRMRVLDKQGKIVGSLNAPEEGKPAPVGITGAYLASRSAWRDPTCVESAPPADAGTTSIFLPGNREDYRIEVQNPSNGGTSVAIHSYDQNGNASVQTQDSTGPLVIGMTFDPTQATPSLQVIQGTAPGSTTGTQTAGTPTLPSGGGGSTGGSGVITIPTTAPATTPGVSPTATRTPVPTPTPVPPSAVSVTCDVVYTPAPAAAGVTCTGTVTGTYTTTRWSVNGLPAPVAPGSTAFSTTFSQDATVSVEMTACNITVCRTGTKSVVVKFTTPSPTAAATPVPGTPTPTPTTPPVGPPPVVTVHCDWYAISGGTQIDCLTEFNEAFNAVTWTTTGGASPASQSSGAKHFSTVGPTAGIVTVQAVVCYNAVCTTSNVASVVIGQAVTIISTDLCGAMISSAGHVATANVDNWTSDRPLPTGAFSWIVNGNIVGVSVVGFGGTSASLSFVLGYTGFSIPLVLEYSGDANWTASSISCSILEAV